MDHKPWGSLRLLLLARCYRESCVLGQHLLMFCSFFFIWLSTYSILIICFVVLRKGELSCVSPLFLQVSDTRCVGVSPPLPPSNSLTVRVNLTQFWRCLPGDRVSSLRLRVRYFPGGTVIKNLPATTGDAGDMGSIAWSGKSPGVGMAIYSSIHGQSGKFCGQRSLAGYSPWGHKESDMTEHNTATHEITSHFKCWS